MTVTKLDDHRSWDDHELFNILCRACLEPWLGLIANGADLFTLECPECGECKSFPGVGVNKEWFFENKRKKECPPSGNESE